MVHLRKDRNVGEDVMQPATPWNDISDPLSSGTGSHITCLTRASPKQAWLQAQILLLACSLAPIMLAAT